MLNISRTPETPTKRPTAYKPRLSNDAVIKPTTNAKKSSYVK